MSQVVRVSLTIDGANPPIARRFGLSSTLSIYNELQIATATTDSTLPIGALAAIDFFYLTSDQALTLNFNSTSGTDITIDANKPIMLSGTALTNIYVSNASGSTANIKYLVAGA